MSSPRTIAVLNQKGGCAKTTTTVNLAEALAACGRTVLVLDLDPQASASAWLGCSPEGAALLQSLTLDDGPSFAELVEPSVLAGVEVIPASPRLVQAERQLVSTLGGELQLSRRLEALIEQFPVRWNYILIDCPPALGLLTANALAAGPEILVPVEASTMALAGLGVLLQTIARARAAYRIELPLAGILACRIDGRTRISREILSHLRDRFAGSVFATSIRESVRLREAWSHSRPIAIFSPGSTGAVDYAALAREVVSQEIFRAA
jgi:chromosome partitioning protein